MYLFLAHDHIVGVTIPGKVQAFSSYPGRLLSGDDYYLIGSKLVGNDLTAQVSYYCLCA